VNILDAINDENVFARAFKDKHSWEAWTAFLAAVFGLGLTEQQTQTYTRCTNRTVPPSKPASEAWIVAGRRGGKSFILALIAVFLTAFRDWRPFLSPGERATIMIIASDRKQARTILRYCRGLLEMVPMLRQLVAAERAEAIDLDNRVTIEVHTASFRAVRGYTICAALLDEVAFWPTEDSASPDTEVINAIRPAMATIPNAMLLCASSPYSRKGALWDTYHRYYGHEGPVLSGKPTPAL
jgi:phage terminase large subunit-like protein